MKYIFKNNIINKRKEFILVLSQFILIFLHFFNLKSFKLSNFLEANTYKNYLSLFIISCGIIVIFISIINLGKNISPFPSPLKNSSLITFGIYKFISHPMYYSCILISIGIFLIKLSIFNLFLTISLVMILKFKINIEEKYLKKKYKNYESYKKDLII